MKGAKLISVTVIVAVCLLVTGIIMTSIGWAINTAYYKKNGYKDVESFDKTISENVEQLDISLNICELKIIKGDELRIEAENFRKESLTYGVKDGKLTIKEEEERRSWFNFNDVQIINNYTPKLTLYIPQDSVYEKVSIKLGVGMATVKDLNTEDLTLECGVGELRGDGLTASKSYIECGVGASNFNNVDFKNLSVSGGVGSTSIEGKIIGLIDVESGIGEITLTINGDEDDYSINANGGIGEITVNGARYRSGDYSRSAENTINADNGIGKIAISFE